MRTARTQTGARRFVSANSEGNTAIHSQQSRSNHFRAPDDHNLFDGHHKAVKGSAADKNVEN
jgi:hypothetical protein